MKRIPHAARSGAPVLAALLLCLLLAACGSTDTQQDYIGTAAAKQAALEDAGLTAADDVTVTLEEADGQAYYTVSFSSGSTDWTSTVDALTGVVTASTSSTAAAEDTAAEEAAAEETVAAEAEETAAAEESAAEQQAAEESTAAETAADTATADAASGTDSSAAQTGSSESGITLEQAQAMALEQAGLTEDAVTITKAKLDQEDGQQVYDIEFRTADAEYDVEISAVTGELLSYDYEATTTAGAASGTAITADEAEALALAQVPGATESDIREFKSDYENGRQVYEGQIVYGGMAYEFEIDASTGSLRSWEAEKVN